MKLKPPANATDFLGKFIELARRRTGRPSQAEATGCGDLKRDKIWAQISQGIFDSYFETALIGTVQLNDLIIANRGQCKPGISISLEYHP